MCSASYIDAHKKLGKPDIIHNDPYKTAYWKNRLCGFIAIFASTNSNKITTIYVIREYINTRSPYYMELVRIGVLNPNNKTIKVVDTTLFNCIHKTKKVMEILKKEHENFQSYPNSYTSNDPWNVDRYDSDNNNYYQMLDDMVADEIRSKKRVDKKDAYPRAPTSEPNIINLLGLQQEIKKHQL